MPDLTLSTVDGSDSIALTDSASPIFLTAGAKGLDVPVPSIFSDISPFLPGELVRGVRDTSREVFLPVVVSGSTKAELWAAKARLFSMLHPVDRTAGCKLTVTDPATGANRYLTVVYAGGAEGDLSADQYGQTWQKHGLVLRAADPYWASTDAQSVTWAGSSTATWFPLFPLTLAPTQLLSGSTVAGTTNLITNPSAEIDLTGWGSTGGAGDPAIVQDTARALYGSVSVRYDWPTAGSGGGNAGVTAAGLTIGVTYTLTVWVWSPTGSPAVQIAVFFVASGTTSSVHDSWQRLTVTFVATATSHYVYVATTTATTAGQQVWVDGWQIEAAGSASAYCDGDQPGCHWNGVPHGSTSTRDATFDGAALDVAGDTSTWPVWTINGPGAALTLQHLGQGRRLDLIGDIPDGTAVTIDTRPRQQAVYDSAGNNLMGRLSPGFSFFALDPGQNTISVALTGSGTNSAVTVAYTPRWIAA